MALRKEVTSCDRIEPVPADASAATLLGGDPWRFYIGVVQDWTFIRDR